jgi:hypothetical protein
MEATIPLPPDHWSDMRKDAYLEGARAACDAMIGDPVYYAVLNGKPGQYAVVSEVSRTLKDSLD